MGGDASLNGKGVDERGIPLKSDYPPLPIPVLYIGFTLVSLAISLGIAFAVYELGPTTKYDAKITLLASYDLGWVYLGLFVVKLALLSININLGISRQKSKVNVPDQQVYKVYTPEGSPSLGYVLMEKDGDLGRFNRAQRALMVHLEQSPFFLVFFLLAGFVFPFPTFVTGCFYSVMRVTSAIGYTVAPQGRIAGNMLGSLGASLLDAFVIFAGFKALTA
mmetsp:Transcript_96422/g.241751  ORF Transcript_96422/g.241751 Transcript_96422/m.241751 type:complete len:220 (+) Transcript_96422:59-718(+)